MLCHLHPEDEAYYWIRSPAPEVIWPLCLVCVETLLDLGAREDAFTALRYKDVIPGFDPDGPYVAE